MVKGEISVQGLSLSRTDQDQLHFENQVALTGDAHFVDVEQKVVLECIV